jgi:hypothetical protein
LSPRLRWSRPGATSARRGGFGEPERWVGPQRGAINVGDVEVADIDGDGRRDLVADTSEGAMVVYRDDPGFETREFGPRGTVEVADFDGDGRVDVAVGTTVFPNRLHRPVAAVS